MIKSALYSIGDQLARWTSEPCPTLQSPRHLLIVLTLLNLVL